MNNIKAAVVLSGATLLVCGCTPPGPSEDLCVGRKAGDLVITEFMSNPASTDTGSEYIEIFNSLGTAVELKGITVYVKKTDGTGLKTHVIRAGTVPARGYMAIGDIRSGPLPAHIGYSYEAALGALPQSEAILGLKCRDTVIDEVQYLKEAKAGHARTFDGSLNPEAGANDDESKWCDASELFSGGNYGSPGKVNLPCASTMVTQGTCLDTDGTSRTVVLPSAGQLVISEVMANPKAVVDTAGEWFEVRANADVDLNGLVLYSGTSKSTVSSADCVHLASSGYAVFAKNSDAGVNGGVSGVASTFGFSLGNSGGSLSVNLPDAGVIDAVTYAPAIDGTAWQLDPTKLTATDNDDPNNLCRATAMYGLGDLGTPGADNTTCPTPVDMNNCIDGTTGLSRPIVRPVVGDVVITEIMAHPAQVTAANGEWFEVLVNSNVDFNGLALSFDTTTLPALTSQACLSATAGSYVVFARKADALVNGGLPAVLGTFTFGLTDTGMHTLSLKNGTTDLDVVTYTTSSPGASLQLSNDKLDATQNDVAANFCVTQNATYGMSPDGGTGDKGSPGAANELCP
ncbi:MAG: lamin tail domain-containing protein [Myxococcaceae bacterium]|nr:lamin tail domain-containing protein [Myxococcaceae bacterium]